MAKIERDAQPKADWMSDAGYESGMRVERLRQQALEARSTMAVFADESIWWFCFILLVGGFLGAMFAAEAVDPLVVAVTGEIHWLGRWVITHVAAYLVGVSVAFLCLDVPITLALRWLRTHRPDLFRARGIADTGSK